MLALVLLAGLLGLGIAALDQMITPGASWPVWASNPSLQSLRLRSYEGL